MSIPPDPSARPSGNGFGQDAPHALPQGRGADNGQRRVVEAEVLHHDGQNGGGSRHGRPDRTERDFYGGAGRTAGAGGFFYGRSFGGNSQGGTGFGQVWASGRTEQNACLTPCITFAIFMVCLAQFGFLAGIGFVFFHTLGSAVGLLRHIRRLGEGRLPNPWPWRLCNWAFSFLLTAWLAGGFK